MVDAAASRMGPVLGRLPRVLPDANLAGLYQHNLRPSGLRSLGRVTKEE